uniref:Histone chaperone asf1-A n=1 Tax=Anoplopoma fimbria TaxID=229290 RepID=C3KJB8_ANOFI|nr:Histone chaperone asf1-A [Anoplopoma fimbria]
MEKVPFFFIHLMEDSENVDPSPNISGMLPPSCIPGKMPPLGLMPDNSMDCM